MTSSTCVDVIPHTQKCIVYEYSISTKLKYVAESLGTKHSATKLSESSLLQDAMCRYDAKTMKP